MRPVVEQSGLTVLLVAESAATSVRRAPDHSTARWEAVIALARATFAVGGRLAVPVDADIAPLVGTLALDYVQLRAAEWKGGRPPPPVVVLETRPSEPARLLLAPLVQRGAVRFVDQHGESLEPIASTERELAGIGDVGRQPVTPEMIDVVQPTLAVLIGADRHTVEDAATVRARGTPTFAFETDPTDEELRRRLTDAEIVDPSGRLLEGTSSSPWGDRKHAPGQPEWAPPYAFLMQRLIAEHR